MNNPNELGMLVVDDDPQALTVVENILQAWGAKNILTVDDSRRVMPLLAERKISLIILDLIMPHVKGQELLAQITAEHPDITVIIMTGMNDLDTAVECMKKGAFDFLTKPFRQAKLIASVEKAVEMQTLRREVAALRRQVLPGEVRDPSRFSSIITKSPKMLALFRYAEAVAGSAQPVLITGETGTGKEVMSRAVHNLSGRKGEFIAVNIAGLDDSLFSDALFGHKRGAFTGAQGDREGLVSRAAGGTLFLDEIGDLRESSQVKLLRLLQEQVYYPVGSDISKRTDCRVIATTNQDLRKKISEGGFRKDLYYRLCSHEIHLPPLRERAEDIPLLFRQFMDEAARSMGLEQSDIVSLEIPGALAGYSFPGNVRELRAMVHDAMAQHRGGAPFTDCFSRLIEQNSGTESPETGEDGLTCAFKRFPTLTEIQEYFVREALKRAKGNQSVAASLLGVTRQALNNRLQRRKDVSDPISSSDSEPDQITLP
ncbi:MAG: sigma-54 dependent transcriptional regulator [Nitrospirota bacterium]